MKVIRTQETKAQKVVPVYPLESIDVPITINNVAKVQPNNFLADNKSKNATIRNNSNSSSLIDLNKSNYSIKNINPNNQVTNNEINVFQDISFVKRTENLRHHSNVPHVVNSDPEKADSETNVDVTSTKNIESYKSNASKCTRDVVAPSHGTGARNILLDNAQNIAPILLTKPAKAKEDVVQLDTNTETSSENIPR